MKEHLDTSKIRMDGAITAFEQHLTTVRSGRANPTMLNSVEIEYYGVPTPLNQVGQISVVEGKQLVVKPFDPSTLKLIEKAIYVANLGLTPQNDGVVIRCNVPSLTQETRKDLTKVVSKLSEEAKVAIRNVRRDVNDHIKKDEALTEDLEKSALEKVQKMTDEYIKKVDAIAEAKTKEIMTV
jgi:ribosome recycling factor